MSDFVDALTIFLAFLGVVEFVVLIALRGHYDDLRKSADYWRERYLDSDAQRRFAIDLAYKSMQKTNGANGVYEVEI